MKKSLAPLLFLFFLHACARKGELSVYLINDFNSLLWDENAKVYSLFNKIKNDPSPKIILETGDFFSPYYPENLQDKHLSAIKAAKLLGVDAICASIDILKTERNDIASQADDLILSSNAYLKSKKKFSPLRYICDSSDKICAMAVHIPDISHPDKAAYTKDYRIENPLYEINKTMDKISAKNVFKVLFMSMSGFDGKKDKKKLFPFLDKISPLPDLIIVKSEKTFSPFKCKNIWIFSAFEEKAAKIYTTEIPFLKIKKAKAEVISLSTGKHNGEYPQIESIGQEKFLSLSEVYSSAQKDFPLKSNSGPSAASLMATIISSYIKSNGAFYSKNAIKKGFQKGEIRLRDVYEAIPLHDRLIYCKIKGHDLEKMIIDSDISQLEYHPFKLNDERQPSLFGEPLKNEKIYRILIPQSAAGKDFALLSYCMEFSVLERTTLDAALWYFRTHKKIY